MKNKYWWLTLSLFSLISFSTNAQTTYFDPIFGENITLMKSTPINKIEVFYDYKKWEDTQTLKGEIYNQSGSNLPLGNLKARIRTHQNTFLWEKDYEITSTQKSIPLNEDLSNLGYYESGAWLEIIAFNSKNRLVGKGLNWLTFKHPTTSFIDIGQESTAHIEDGEIKISMDLIGAQNQKNVIVKTQIYRNNTVPKSLIEEYESIINLNKNAFSHELAIQTPKEKGGLLVETQLFKPDQTPMSSKKQWHIHSEGPFFELKYLTVKPNDLEKDLFQVEVLGLSNQNKLNLNLIFEDEKHTIHTIDIKPENNVWSASETVQFPAGIYNATFVAEKDGQTLISRPLDLSKYRPRINEEVKKGAVLSEKKDQRVFIKLTIIALGLLVLTLLWGLWKINRKKALTLILAISLCPISAFASDLENTWIFPPKGDIWSFSDRPNSDFRHIPISGTVEDTVSQSNPFSNGRIVDMATRFVHIDTGEVRTFFLSSNIHTDLSSLSWLRSFVSQLLGFLFGWGGATYGEYFYVLDLNKIVNTESEEGVQGTLAEGDWEIQPFFEIKKCYFFCLFTYGSPTWYATDTIDGETEFRIDRTGPQLSVNLKDSNNQSLASEDFTNQPIKVQIDCQDPSDCANNQGVFQAIVKGNFCDNPAKCDTRDEAIRTYEVCDNIGNCSQVNPDINNYDVTGPNVENFALGIGNLFNSTLRAQNKFKYKINYNEIDTVAIDNQPGVSNQTETLGLATYQNLFDSNACGEAQSSHFTLQSNPDLCGLAFTPCVEGNSYYTSRGVQDENQNCIASCPSGYLFHWFYQQCYKP